MFSGKSHSKHYQFDEKLMNNIILTHTLMDDVNNWFAK